MIIKEKQIKNAIKKVLKEYIQMENSSELFQYLDKYFENVFPIYKKATNTLLNYLEKNLGVALGTGSSRKVYGLDDGLVLKLAYNIRGKIQNQEEYESYMKNKDLKCIAKVYKVGHRYGYLVSEECLPATDSDFAILLGTGLYNDNTTLYGNDHTDYNKYQQNSSVNNIRSLKKNYDYNNMSFDNFIRWCREVKESGGIEYIDEKNDCGFYEACQKNENLMEIYKFIERNDVLYGDITTDQNLGITTRDGKPYFVIIDYGITLEKFKKFY